jgi:hypothetical protein
MVAEVGLDKVHDVSVGRKPTPLANTSIPTGPLTGVSVMVAPIVTLKMSVAKSPTLGVQPLLPPHPVTSITYCPGNTLPMKKLPSGLPDPAFTEHPAFRIMVTEVGLEIVHEVSVGR